MPATYFDSQQATISRVHPGNILNVLRQEMLVTRLNKVHQYMWWLERLPSALPLHENLMENRNIIITEQVDLHLVCPTGIIFIKPLPPYLLYHDFWTAHICEDLELYKCCAGFLLSYVWRIRNESDLALALEYRLVPRELTWRAWSLFVASFLSHVEAKGGASNCVNKRYMYGELKLTRLQIVRRQAPDVFGLEIHVNRYDAVSTFFKRKFAWMGLAFLYLVAILTAMQVGLAVDQLRDNSSFNWASYAFAVFCILLPIMIVAVHLLRHAISFLYFSAGMMRETSVGHDLHKMMVPKWVN
jgi:Family of unknown function (DUF6601)